MYNDFRHMCKFGDERYRGPMWHAVKTRWTKIGEKHVADRFEQEHVEKYSGWQSGQGAYGSPHNNQAQERGHQENVIKPLKFAQQRDFNSYTKAVPVDYAIRQLGIHLVTKSKELEKEIKEGRGFDLTRTYERKEAADGEKWALDAFTVKLGPGLYACRQNTEGTNILVTVDECKRTLAIHKKILNGTFERELTWKEAKLVFTIIFTSLEACFPCLCYMDSLGCYMKYGARFSEGLDCPASALLQNHLKDTIQNPDKSKKRTKKRKAAGFNSNPGTLPAT